MTSESNWDNAEKRAMAELRTSEDNPPLLPTAENLNRLQWTTIHYYLHETNPDNGLVRDKTDLDAPSSIAAIGLGLATTPVVVERGVVIRKFAAKLARRRLCSLLDLPQGPGPDVAGYKGFFYHFLDIDTGRGVWNGELSRSTQRSCSRARSPAAPTSTPTPRTR